MSLTIGIATRGRPQMAAETAIMTFQNVRGDTQIILLCDHDDEAPVVPSGIMVSVEMREDSVGSKWNRMMRIAPADVYLAMCDRRAQVTPGFDTGIMSAAGLFPDGIGCIGQHMINYAFPAYQAVTARMVEIMGHFYVDHFPFWFVDHWLDDIARMIGRYVYAPGATFEKPYPNGGRTQELRDPHLWATLYDAQYIDRESIANRLLDAMAIHEWQRIMLRAQWPLIHQRSQMINNQVRMMDRNAIYEMDDRYKRIRAAGADKLYKLYQQLEAA